MSATKITTMAQLRDALKQGGYISKSRGWGSSNGFATFHPKDEEKDKWGHSYGVDVSLVAFNALMNRGELRRLVEPAGPSYGHSKWVLKSAGYTLIEAEAKVTAAKGKLEAAQRVADEAIAAYKAAQAVLDAAEAELAKLVPAE